MRDFPHDCGKVDTYAFSKYCSIVGHTGSFGIKCPTLIKLNYGVTETDSSMLTSLEPDSSTLTYLTTDSFAPTSLATDSSALFPSYI